MSNGWRDGLLATWVIMLVGAVGFWIGAVVIVQRGQNGLIDPIANLPVAGFLAGAGSLFTIGAFFGLLAWLAVSAIVREHHRDREHADRTR